MTQAILPITDLPVQALDAAAHFHAEYLPQARELLEGPVDALLLHFPSDDASQRGWQLAAVQSLARMAAPKRVNAIAGPEQPSSSDIADWLEAAPGITGQLLRFGGNAL